ncbi:hypothetical protein ACH33_07610 [Aneurinibacillus sp. XH2]|uniref:BsuBI/PstI family type II restriction endonuclease n=1 Tax=Aneurinibacillus sp. XH2 TaxID=1450761 RepID=UPI00070A8606|nr:BsuBI/PstI family type II restriction endonuclease [Aneurinibacillus sp. XH2]AMA72731.1 hypothetical protein ACH33_07610 [Aneurinibacillus sp. XH2]
MISGLNTIVATSMAEYANALAVEYNQQSSSEEKKEKGQYFTPLPIARFMADMAIIHRKRLRILDPGSGTGVLASALCDRILQEDRDVAVEVDLYETDNEIIPLLCQVMEICKEKFEASGREFQYRIIEEDFITSNAGLFENEGLFAGDLQGEQYDIVISNPPYFKLRKDSIYARILNEYVHGQPNIYFMFMVVAEKLTKQNGQLIFITPRSYCSGAYFEEFRKRFLEVVDPHHIHIFESRKETFFNEKVLQESIILSAFKRMNKGETITISQSTANIEDTYTERHFDHHLVVDSSLEDTIIRIPVTEEDEKIVRLFDSWGNNLSAMNMEISTGPVVNFRAKESIEVFESLEKHYPLLYMQNLRNMGVTFPVDGKKNEGIKKDTEDKKLLLPCKNYVLIKRFTSKEQKKRVDVSVFLARQFPFEQVGLENHLNYIYKINGELTEAETIGLAAILNSRLVDSYFRIVNGNTQVNASDIRALPLPEESFIVKIGEDILAGKITYEEIDALLERELGTVTTKIEEAINIIEMFGLPKKQQNERSALTLLALLGLRKQDKWQDAQPKLLRVHDIMEFIKDEYDKVYAENSRETIRRQTIHQFEDAALVERNPDDKTRPTNSGKTVYAVTDEALQVIRAYGTEKWDELLSAFLDAHPKLVERYAKKRNVHRVPIRLENGDVLELSAGKHNLLQKAIVEEFAAIFAQGSHLVYLGDTANKQLHVNKELLAKLNIPDLNHDKLPDVVLYHEEKNWLYLIEAVTSHGPVSPTRVAQLEDMLKDCNAGKIYVSAFLDMKDFKKYAADIAWDTEVWFADMPEHMLHYNGDRFMGPRDRG